MHNIRVFLFIDEKMEHERFLTPTHTPPKYPVNHKHVGDLYTFFSFFRCFQIEMLCRNFYQEGSQSLKDTKGGHLILNKSFGGINCRRVTSLDLLLIKSTPPLPVPNPTSCKINYIAHVGK